MTLNPLCSIGILYKIFLVSCLRYHWNKRSGVLQTKAVQ